MIQHFFYKSIRALLVMTFTALPLLADAPKETPPPQQMETNSNPPINLPQEPQTKRPSHAQASQSFLNELKEVENTGDDHFLSEFLNMLATLGLIVAALLFVTWLMKRLLNTRIQQINTSSVIKIVEKRTLTPKTSLYLLEIPGKEIFIAESLNGVTLLGSFSPDTDSDTPEEQPPADFSKLLQNKLKT